MTDRALLDALRALLTALAPPASPAPEWVPLEHEAQRRGKSTASLRAWCLARGVEIREGNHRDAWVRPAAIDEAVERLPLAKPRTTAPDTLEEIDNELRHRTG